MPSKRPVKYRLRELMAETQAELEAAMSETEFRTVQQIATILNKNKVGTEKKLRRLLDKERVERMQEPVKGGGLRYVWRKLPEGYVAPLYEPQRGIDPRALDAALGGHTYLRPRSITGESK